MEEQFPALAANKPRRNPLRVTLEKEAIEFLERKYIQESTRYQYQSLLNQFITYLTTGYIENGRNR